MFSREREREVRASPSESYCIILLSVQMGGREAAGRRRVGAENREGRVGITAHAHSPAVDGITAEWFVTVRPTRGRRPYVVDKGHLPG